MLSRRNFVQNALLGIAAAMLHPPWPSRPTLPELPAMSNEIVIVDGWVLLADDLAAVLA
jgi:hypothetical protein